MLEKSSKTDLIVFLLRGGAGSHPMKISTIELANELGVSQQSASRWLLELEKEGMVERSQGGIRLTPYCVARCRTLFLVMKKVFEAKRGVSLDGLVSKGVGDGKYYLSMPEYKRQVKEKLGFVPFPGTLNLSLADQSRKAALYEFPGIELEGFMRAGRMLGAAKCFKCEVRRATRARGGKAFPCAAIVPLRSHYGSGVLELISPVSLRKKLSLRNGSRVFVDVEVGSA